MNKLVLCLIVASLCSFAQAAYPVTFKLAQYGMMQGLSSGVTNVYQAAQRSNSPAMVDWANYTIFLSNGTNIDLWQENSQQTIILDGHNPNTNLFQASTDDTIQPSALWFRYSTSPAVGCPTFMTTNRTMRAWCSILEVWGFPILFAPVVPGLWNADIQIGVAGRIVYSYKGQISNLTLITMPTQDGYPYEVTVNGVGPLTMEVGFQPVEVGAPQELLKFINLTFSASGGAIMVSNLPQPAVFPSLYFWNQDMTALPTFEAPVAPLCNLPNTLSRHFSLGVPRSTVLVNIHNLPHGMSDGTFWPGSNGTTNYADFVASMGFDRAFDSDQNAPEANSPKAIELWASLMCERGIRVGLVHDYMSWNRPYIEHPNAPFQAASLPEFHAPLYRSLQIASQRLSHYPNYEGISIGADNAGYTQYWDWSNLSPQRQWSEAMINFMGTFDIQIPINPVLKSFYPENYYLQSNTSEHINFVEKYAQTWTTSYDYWYSAVQEVNPTAIFTTGSYGSAPGVGGNGGYAWASIPGYNMYLSLPVQQVYDWDEYAYRIPFHNAMLIDLMNSYFPGKETWSIINDFDLWPHSKVRVREAQYAIDLTRGVQSVAQNWMPAVNSPEADDITAVNQWVHTYGGIYSDTKPFTKIGIVFSHQQALNMGIVGQESDLDGSHEGYANEAMVAFQAAGVPARFVTVEEIARGNVTDVDVLFLAGLRGSDDTTWFWTSPNGIFAGLQAFENRGGKIIADKSSFFPSGLNVVSIPVSFYSYVIEQQYDSLPTIIQRNAQNIPLIQSMAKGLNALPIVTSNDPTWWAIPHITGNTLYVTVADALQNRSSGAVINLQWNSTQINSRPIYDVRAKQQITIQAAASCDLTTFGFQVYALPIVPIATAKFSITLQLNSSSLYYFGTPTLSSSSATLVGVPVQVDIKSTNDSVTIYTSTGQLTTFPLHASDPNGQYTIILTELLSSSSSSFIFQKNNPPPIPPPTSQIDIINQPVVEQFVKRVDVPLTIGLTPAQMANTSMVSLAQMLAGSYAGRTISLRTVDKGDIIIGQQVYQCTYQYPQWATIKSDLVIFGSLQNNVLLMDQSRANLLPSPLPPNSAQIFPTFSPFAGEFQVINVLAEEEDLLVQAIKTLAALNSGGSFERNSVKLN